MGAFNSKYDTVGGFTRNLDTLYKLCKCTMDVPKNLQVC